MPFLLGIWVLMISGVLMDLASYIYIIWCEKLLSSCAYHCMGFIQPSFRRAQFLPIAIGLKIVHPETAKMQVHEGKHVFI